MPVIGGTVYDNTGAAAAGRIVRAYRRDTGVLLGQTTTGTGAATPGDSSYANVSLLLHCDGVDGSTTFLDSSPSPKVITVLSGASVTTSQSKFGGASASFLGVSGNRLSAPPGAHFNFGSGDFTIEAWVRPDDLTDNKTVINQYTGSGNRSWDLLLLRNAVHFRFTANGTSDVLSLTSAVIPSGVWTHVAVTRDGSNFRVFSGGVVGESKTSTSAVFSSTGSVAVGYNQEGAWPFKGQIDEIRITKGVARYTTNFTPPTAAFPDSAELPAAPVGSYALDTGSYSGECNVICLDDDAGTLYNDLIDRVIVA